MLANAPMFARVLQFRKGKTTPAGTRGQLIRRNRNGMLVISFYRF